MRLFSCLVLGLWSLSSGVALAQSPEPSCLCGRPEPARFAPPRFVAPAMLMPTSGRAEPVIVRTARIESPAAEFIADVAPLQISLSERLLNQLMADERAEIGPVRDVIADANVIGQQATTTRVVVDVRPSSGFAELHLVLTGVVSSETVGITSQAAVNTLGRHDVLAIKPVMFDGHQITTRRPRVWVDVHSEHVGAQTAYDGTLFGGFARNVALKTANRQRDQVDAETAEHLVAQLGPKFNREADQQLGRFNREWREGGKARFGKLWPQSLVASSTDSQLLISATWADAPALAINDTRVVSGKALAAGHSADNVDLASPVASAMPLKASVSAFDADAVTIRLHESAINAWLKRLELGGKTLTETELREPFDALMIKLGGRVLRRENKLANQPLPGTAPLIRLGKNDPVRVSFADGELRLMIVASIEVAGQTVLAQDEITVPFSSKIERGEWRAKAGQLAFAKGGNGITLASMVETLVRNQLATAFPDVVLPDSIPLPGSVSNPSMPALRLSRAEATSGWLTLSLSFGGTSPRGPTPEPQPEEPRPFEIVPPRLIVPMRLESRRAPRGWFE
ncbi:MAG: hypothetical protein ACKV2Q_33715 [Planctomycetaceae bacterium]